VTLGDLKRHIYLEFGLDKTADGDEDLLMEDWATQGVMDVLRETNVGVVNTNTITLSAGVSEYQNVFSTAPNILKILDVRLTSAQRDYFLEKVKLRDILKMKLASAANDIPRYYSLEGGFLAVYPPPSATMVINTYSVQKPTALTADANDLANTTYGGLPDVAQDAVLWYMRWRAAIYDEKKAPHKPSEFRQFYDDALVRVRRNDRRRGGRSAVGLSAGYPSRFGSTGTRNDRYPPE